MDRESIRHAFFQCPRVREIWQHLVLGRAVDIASTEGSLVLAELLRDNSSPVPLLPNVLRAGLVDNTVWYVWWERQQATRGENVQIPTRSAQPISAMATNFL